MKGLYAVVTRNGTVTVPTEIRRTLGLKSGDKVAFVVDRGEVKLVRRASVVERTAGAEKAIADEVAERAAE